MYVPQTIKLETMLSFFSLIDQINLLFMGRLVDFGLLTDAGFLVFGLFVCFLSASISFETEHGNETPALIKQQGGVWTLKLKKRNRTWE